MGRTPASSTAEAQIQRFIEKFDPEIAARIGAVRAALRARFPTANELVYDNYNFFVIGYSPTERPSDTVVSLAANAKGLGLAFYWGDTLPDPHGLLEGSGKQNRFIRLASASRLNDPRVEELLRAAVAQSRVPFPADGGRSVVRSISRKQRPRRAPP